MTEWEFIIPIYRLKSSESHENQPNGIFFIKHYKKSLRN